MTDIVKSLEQSKDAVCLSANLSEFTSKITPSDVFFGPNVSVRWGYFAIDRINELLRVRP